MFLRHPGRSSLTSVSGLIRVSSLILGMVYRLFRTPIMKDFLIETICSRMIRTVDQFGVFFLFKKHALNLATSPFFLFSLIRRSLSKRGQGVCSCDFTIARCENWIGLS